MESCSPCRSRTFPDLSRHFDNLHSKASHAVLKAAPSAAAIGRLSVRRLASLLIGVSRGRLGVQKAKALRESAKQSWLPTARILPLICSFAP